LNNFNLSVIREDYRYQTVRKLVLVLGVNSVNQTFSDFYKALDKLIKYCMMNDLIISEIHLTSGQPSILSSGNDMTKSLKDRDCFLALLQQAENISDHCMFGISDLFVGELAYECHHDGDQCEFLKFLHSGFLKVKESQSNELKFAYTGILCRFHISNGNLEKAKKTMQRFLNAESVKAEELLYINGNAFMAWLALFENDELSVMNWLLESQMESLEVCNMVNQYVKLMQIRVYIAKYDYEQAELIISQLLFYLQQTDGFYMEQKVMILRGYHFYKNNQMEWQNIIETVIENCREYQIIQLISEEGIVIYPLLLELSKKERYKKDCYFESVLKTAQKQAERYPFYLGAQQDHFMSTLTEREKRVLELMSMGKTNKEIAEILFISARTVKAHNTSIFSKLKVNNRGKAIKKYLTVN
ncbi:MAG: LuxR C-terminal-related transcriptional regulator, partial [Eubacterium sp.]